MNLVWSTADFVLSGESYPGFPILLDDGMRSVAPVNEFMRYYLLMRGSIRSRNSWPNTGRALYDYFSYLQAHHLDWRPTESDAPCMLIASYRNYSLSVHKLSVGTVRQRILYVTEFYEYALTQRWISRLPFAYESAVPGRPSLLEHVDHHRPKSERPDVKPRAVSKPIQFLSLDETRSLIRAAVNPHHQMIIRFALQTGLRRDEIASFPLSYIACINANAGTSRNVSILLDPNDGSGMRTKRSVPRHIVISRRFLRDVQQYILHTRGERAQISKGPRRELFLNQDGEPFSGSGKGICRIVCALGHSVGVRAWTHKLRHTYATHTLHAMQTRGSNVLPIVFLRDQLGHKSIRTTMNYLHLVKHRADEAVLAYDEELNDWAQGCSDA